MFAYAPTILRIDTSADTAAKRDHFGLAGSATPGSTVAILQDGIKLASVRADDAGNFDYQFPLWPSPEHHTYSAISTAADGYSASSNALELELGRQSPLVPTLSLDYYHAYENVHYLHAEGNVLSGVSTPAATIRIDTSYGPNLVTRADADGNWSIALPRLDDAIYIFTATATNYWGTSNGSAQWICTVDNQAPAAPKLFLGNGVNNVLSDDNPTFYGYTEPSTTVELSINGTVMAKTEVGLDGLYELSIRLPIGSYRASASVTDRALNQSIQSPAFDFTVSQSIDAAPDPSTTAQLAIGSSVQGMMAPFGDHDWYQVALEANRPYQFKLTAQESSAGTLYLYSYGNEEDYLHLWGLQSDGTPVEVGVKVPTPRGAPQFINYTPSRSGVYYLDMGAKNNGGSYTLSATILKPDDHGNDNQHATSLPLNTKLTGQFDYPGDLDQFALNLKAGLVYTVTLDSGKISDGAVSRSLLVAGGPEVRSTSSGLSPNGVISLTLAPSKDGVYYVSASGGTGDYIPYHLQLTENTDDYPANIGTSGRVLPDTLAQGRLDSSLDADWFRGSMTGGTTYVLQALASYRTLLDLQMFDQSGKAIAFDANTQYGADAILWQAPYSGDYFVQVAGTSLPLDYTLRVSPVPADDYAADKTSTGRLSENSSISGNLEIPYDIDWFSLNLQAGSDYVFTLDSDTHGHTLLAGGKLELLDATGQSLRQAQGGSSDSPAQLVYHADRTGTFFLSVSDLMQRRTGSYGVTMYASDQDKIPAQASTNITLAPNQVKQSAIDYATDADWYRVDMKGQHWYNFQLTGTGGRGGTLPSSSLSMYLVDANGNNIASQITLAGADPTLRYYAQSDTTYYLAISAFHNATGSYTLKSSLDNYAFVDTLPPLYKSLSGIGEGRIFERGHSLEVNFDEIVSMGSGVATLRLASGELVDEFSAAKGNASMALGSGTLMLNPATLAYDTDYVLTLAAGSVADTSQHVLESTTIKFHTPVSPARQDGSAANEIFRSPAGNQIIDGKGGVDIVIMPGTASDYLIRKSGDLLTIDGWFQPQGRHTLLGIERVQFDDRTLAFDIDGNAGQAYRIYQAAYARSPDKGGLGFWIRVMDQGVSLVEVADAFVRSNEFMALYSSASSNRAVLEKMYDNVLHRAPDAGGLNWYLNLLDSKVITVAQALADISESAENKAALIGVMQNGFEYTPYG